MKRFALALSLLTVLNGCVHSQRDEATTVPGPNLAHLVFFPSSAHRSVYVEVDEVEGTEFSKAELNRLQALLSEWTKKPEGVSVVKSSVIPRSAARGHSADSLARRYLDGPPAATNGAQAAYIYILVYDNRVNRNPVQSPQGASQWPARQLPRKLSLPENPHINTPYLAMIYLDRSWLGGLLPQKYWFDSLAHEAGHVLGLVSREKRVDGFHCPTRTCVMHHSTADMINAEILRWLKREKPKPFLCDECEAELRESRDSTADSLARFVGPVLVRTTSSYHVLSLPGFCGLYIGDSVEGEVGPFMEQFRQLTGTRGPWLTANIKANQDRELVQHAIDAAKEDIDPAVRASARRLERAFRGEGEKQEQSWAEKTDR